MLVIFVILAIIIITLIEIKKMDLKQGKSILIISIVVFFLAVITVIATTDNADCRIIWEIARVFTFIAIVMMLGTVIASTMICKNKNDIKPKWLKVTQSITIICVILTVIIVMASMSMNKGQQEAENKIGQELIEN